MSLCNIHIGLSLFGVSGRMGIDLSAMHALTFSSLIAAVDPVAVSNTQLAYSLWMFSLILFLYVNNLKFSWPATQCYSK